MQYNNFNVLMNVMSLFFATTNFIDNSLENYLIDNVTIHFFFLSLLYLLFTNIIEPENKVSQFALYI